VRVRKGLDGQRITAVVDRSYVENGDFLSQFSAKIQARLNLSEQVDGLTASLKVVQRASRRRL